MKRQPVYMICGVPASGKTWVCLQLQAEYTYVPHDDYIGDDFTRVLDGFTKRATKPVLTECPFGERQQREDLESLGITVYPYFIIEAPEIVVARYRDRGNKPYPKASFTRASTIVNRALEWKSPAGKSGWVLEVLKTEAKKRK